MWHCVNFRGRKWSAYYVTLIISESAEEQCGRNGQESCRVCQLWNKLLVCCATIKVLGLLPRQHRMVRRSTVSGMWRVPWPVAHGSLWVSSSYPIIWSVRVGGDVHEKCLQQTQSVAQFFVPYGLDICYRKVQGQRSPSLVTILFFVLFCFLKMPGNTFSLQYFHNFPIVSHF